MNSGILLIFIIFIPLLVLEAIFAAAEIALVSANRRRLHHRAEEGHRGAQLALQLLGRPEQYLSATLLGAYLAAAANTVLVTAFFLGVFGQQAEIPVMICLPPLILILGEIIPKSVGRQQATLLAERLAPALWLFYWVFSPIIWIFGGISRAVLLITGVRQTGQAPFITREDLRLVVAKSGPEVDLQGTERLFIHRILQFSLRTVKEVMVPLFRVSAIPDTLTIQQAREEFRDTLLLPPAHISPAHRQPQRGAPQLRPAGGGARRTPHQALRPNGDVRAGGEKDRPAAHRDAAGGQSPGGGGGRIWRRGGHCHH